MFIGIVHLITNSQNNNNYSETYLILCLHCLALVCGTEARIPHKDWCNVKDISSIRLPNLNSILYTVCPLIDDDRQFYWFFLGLKVHWLSAYSVSISSHHCGVLLKRNKTYIIYAHLFNPFLTITSTWQHPLDIVYM